MYADGDENVQSRSKRGFICTTVFIHQKHPDLYHIHEHQLSPVRHEEAMFEEIICGN